MRALFAFVAVLIATSALAEDRVLTIWGMSYGPDTKGQEAVNREFERRNPGLKLRVLGMGAGNMSQQKLLTSIVGDSAPDVVYQDRFAVADWASRGAFLPLDEFLDADPDAPKAADYYPAVWREATWAGKVYGIPKAADNRALYWNRKVFRENAASLRAAGLDPERPPRTWSELLAYSKALTRFSGDGRLLQAGFMPNYGNVGLYMYAFQNNASFMSDDGRTCRLASKEAVAALQYIIDGYQIVGGYSAAKSFESGFLARESSPFYTGKIAMMIDGDWRLNEISRFAPGLDFAVAPPPVPDDRFYGRGRFVGEKDQFITWSGGHCLVIPRGARNVQDAWNYIKFASSLDGMLIEIRAQAAWEKQRGRSYIPKQYGNMRLNRVLLREFMPKDPKFAAALQAHVALMPHTRVRPSTFVGQLLWDEHVRAFDTACYEKATPEQALLAGQRIVQKELDAYFSRERYPVVDASFVPLSLSLIGIVLAGLIFLFFRRQRMGKLARYEARWGMLLTSPWILGFIVFTLGPMLVSLYWSFTMYSVLSPPRYVGWKNYQDMFTTDWANIYKAFFNTIYVSAFGVPLSIATGICIALLLNSAVRGMRFYRTFFYMPSIVSGVASAVLWGWVLMPDPSKGLLNSLWQATLTKWLSLPAPGWFTSEPWAKHTLIIMGLWGAGSGMVLWLAGLKGVPSTLYEASALDGAGPWKQFWRVTMPQLSPIVFFSLVMGFIGSLQEFDRVFILKGSDGPTGPADSLLTPVFHLFNNGFGQFRLGYASAIAWLVFLIILAVSLIQFVIAPRWVHYEADPS